MRLQGQSDGKEQVQSQIQDHLLQKHLEPFDFTKNLICLYKKSNKCLKRAME